MIYSYANTKHNAGFKITKLFAWFIHLFSTVSVNILARQIKAGIDKRSKFIDGNHSRYVECM